MTLSILFFFTAALYACIGFGGGSTYSAILILNKVDYQVLPFMTLICNIIVVSGSAWYFSMTQNINIKKIMPWISLSIPAACLGGYIQVPKYIFIGLLGSMLLLSGIKMLWPEKKSYSTIFHDKKNFKKSFFVASSIGACLGLLAGITGIGGGIILAPVLYFLRWGNPKNISGTCSLFILANSLSGLVGQAIKLQQLDLLLPATEIYWYLFPAVLIGGQIGSWRGAFYFNTNTIKLLTACLIIIVAIRLLYSLTTSI